MNIFRNELLLRSVGESRRDSRRGSVLIMVVALLVLLALMGSAFIITSRLDRQASVPMREASNLNDTASSLLTAQQQLMRLRIIQDVNFYTGVAPSFNLNADVSSANSRYLGSRTPTIMPVYTAVNAAYAGTADSYCTFDGTPGNPTTILQNPAASSPGNPYFTPQGRQVAWPAISRPPVGFGFHSPLRANAPPGSGAPGGGGNYDYGQSSATANVKYNGIDLQDDSRWWYVPTHVVIQYDQNAINNGASPELLVERLGDDVRSHPLAGTTARTGDPDTDARLAAELIASTKNQIEHRVVIDVVNDALLPFCSYLDWEFDPSIVTVANVQHLGTAVAGKLSHPAPCVLTLVDALKPTPALGGHPRHEALRIISELEPFDRGRYGGAVGWVDARGNGTWAVSIRCAEIDGHTARLFAGVGVVAESDPDAELAETQAKFQAMLSAIVRP